MGGNNYTIFSWGRLCISMRKVDRINKLETNLINDEFQNLHILNRKEMIAQPCDALLGFSQNLSDVCLIMCY